MTIYNMCIFIHAYLPASSLPSQPSFPSSFSNRGEL